MHDIDRTQGELIGEGEGELLGELFEFGETGAYGQEVSGEGEAEVFHEVELMELASELLGVQNEMELDRFLGNLFSKATKAVGSFVRSPVGKALGGALKTVAKKALPIAGKAIGGAVGGPIGSWAGGKLGDFASGLFELELEGLSAEDREFEVAKQFVRLAGSAAKAASRTPATAHPAKAAQSALALAAKTHAPGLLRPTNGACPPMDAASTPARGMARTLDGRPSEGRNSGRWVRRGNSILVLGV